MRLMSKECPPAGAGGRCGSINTYGTRDCGGENDLLKVVAWLLTLYVRAIKWLILKSIKAIPMSKCLRCSHRDACERIH